MPLTAIGLKEILDELIREGKGDTEVMVSIPIGWCSEHNHMMKCYTEISLLREDSKRSLLLLEMPDLREIIEAVSEAKEVH